MKKIVVVTGSRKWRAKGTIFRALGAEQPDLVIHGGAYGADKIAQEWCEMMGVQFLEVSPDYRSTLYSAVKAPLVRNIEMARIVQGLQLAGAEVVVLAFPLPGSRGTPHMMGVCARMGFAVFNCLPSSGPIPPASSR